MSYRTVELWYVTDCSDQNDPDVIENCIVDEKTVRIGQAPKILRSRLDQLMSVLKIRAKMPYL